MNLFIAPHPDDETLYGAFTVQTAPAVVAVFVTPCIEPERWIEFNAAMRVLRVKSLKIKSIDEIKNKYDKIYVPAKQGGHPFHDEVHDMAKAKYGKQCILYSTYTEKKENAPTGRIKVPYNQVMLSRKLLAMMCYKSQHIIAKVHFDLKNIEEYLY